MRRKRTLLFPFLCIGVLLLTACGTHQENSSNSTGDHTASASAPPTSVAKKGTLIPGKVTVAVGKMQYASSEVITVTISNGLTTSIAAANHQSDCTIVTLQWQDAQGNWQNQNRCRQGAMTRMITFPSQSSQVQSLSPTSGTFARNAQWAKGHYRIVFSFTHSSVDVESVPMTGVPGSPIYSPTFVVV